MRRALIVAGMRLRARPGAAAAAAASNLGGAATTTSARAPTARSSSCRRLSLLRLPPQPLPQQQRRMVSSSVARAFPAAAATPRPKGGRYVWTSRALPLGLSSIQHPASPPPPPPSDLSKLNSRHSIPTISGGGQQVMNEAIRTERVRLVVKDEATGECMRQPASQCRHTATQSTQLAHHPLD